MRITIASLQNTIQTLNNEATNYQSTITKMQEEINKMKTNVAMPEFKFKAKEVMFQAPKSKVMGKKLVKSTIGDSSVWYTYLIMQGKKGNYNMPIDSAKYMSGTLRMKMDEFVGNVFRPTNNR